jgi:hypothetical protein
LQMVLHALHKGACMLGIINATVATADPTSGGDPAILGWNQHAQVVVERASSNSILLAMLVFGVLSVVFLIAYSKFRAPHLQVMAATEVERERAVAEGERQKAIAAEAMKEGVQSAERTVASLAVHTVALQDAQKRAQEHVLELASLVKGSR